MSSAALASNLAMAAAAKARKARVRASARNQKLERMEFGAALESEVGQEEAEAMFVYMQTRSPAFHSFSSEELSKLVTYFSLLRFDRQRRTPPRR